MTNTPLRKNLKSKNFETMCGVITETAILEAESALSSLSYRSVPKWLGNFFFKGFGGRYGKKDLPEVISKLADELAPLCRGQTFNTIFCQSYPAGSFVAEHRDPKNNLGKTVLLVLGDFEGAVSTIDGEEVALKRGDVCVQSCFENGVQGPVHRVSPVLSGHRYALILNTIRK